MQYYHVISQSEKGKLILQDDADCLTYLGFVREACEKYQVSCLAYALMPNHIHLLLGCETAESDDDNSRLKKVRFKISSGYAAYVRKKYPTLFPKGHRIFQSNGATKCLQTTYDLKRVICYIHLNPIRKQLEQTLGESVRSSYCGVLAARTPTNRENPFNYYYELREIRDMLDSESVFRVFGRSHANQEQAFVVEHQSALQKDKIEQPPESPLPNKFEDAENILRLFFNEAHASRGKKYDAQSRQAYLNLLCRNKNPQKTLLVRKIARDTLLTGKEIAEFLGISESTVKRILNWKGERRA